MDLFDKIDDIMEQEDHILPKKDIPKKLDMTFDEGIFNKMANFIIKLNPDMLSDSQLEFVINMIEDFEIEVNKEDIKEASRLSNRSTVGKNNASKKWYRENKTEIKQRKEKLKRTFNGRKKERSKERLEKTGKTPGGRKKSRYHVRKRSDRGDREKNLN